MNIPIPPLIPSDSQYSTFKSTITNVLNKLIIPKYESTDDVISPIIGMLIHNTTDNTLEVYTVSGWKTISSGPVYTQQGSKLVGTGAIGNAFQGFAVSLSDDGNTLAVGGSRDNGGVGATWIYTRSAGVWTQQGSKLVGTDGGISNQGFSVSLSSDGNTLAVGGSGGIENTGATWIFTRTAGVWTQQGPKLVGATGTQQGYSVSLSSDGNTLAFGARQSGTLNGATYIYTRTVGVWTQQGPALVGSGGVSSFQGSGVSLSSDGNTLAVGGSRDNGNIGATWIFTREAGVWTQQGSKLVGTGGVGASRQGEGVALSDDGDTLAVGGINDNGNIGATWIFTRTAGVWTQQGSKLVGSGAIGNALQGRSVSFNSDGNTLAVSGNNDNSGIGAAWIFKRTAGVWTQQGSKYVGTGNVGNSLQAYSLSLSSDSGTLAMGGLSDNGFTGAVWVFIS